MATNWDDINAQIAGRSAVATKPTASSQWNDINAQITARAKTRITPAPTPVQPSGFDKAVDVVKSGFNVVKQGIAGASAPGVEEKKVDPGLVQQLTKRDIPIPNYFNDNRQSFTIGENVDKARAATTLENSMVAAQNDQAIKQQAAEERPGDASPYAAPLAASSLFLLPALINAPVANAVKFGMFEGLQKIEDKLNLHLRDLAPDSADDKTKQLLDVVQMLGNGYAAHGIFTKAPAVADAFTKQVTTQYKLPSQVTIPGSAIRAVFSEANPGAEGSAITSKQLEQFSQTTGLSKADIKNAAQNGLNINVPAQVITRMVDKPWWGNLKDAIGLKPSMTKGTVTTLGEQVKAPAGLLELNPQKAPLPAGLPEPAPQLGLPAPTGAKSNVLRGEGFTAQSAASKEELARAKLYSGYRQAVESFSKAPTPAKLEKVLALRSQVQGSGLEPAPQGGTSMADQLSTVVEKKAQIAVPTMAEQLSGQVAAQPARVAAPTMAEQLQTIVEAPKQDLGTTAPAKAALDINKALVEKGIKALPESELAQYGTYKVAEQTDRIAELMASDLGVAQQMALGKAEIPDNIKPQILYNAIKAQAKAEGNTQLMMDLAKSPIASQRSEAASTLGSSAINNGTLDPVEIIHELNKKMQTSKKATKAQDETKKKFRQAVKKARAPKQSWNDFVDSITC